MGRLGPSSPRAGCPAPSAEEEPALPAALHQRGAEAFGRLRTAIAEAATLTLHGPDGRSEHQPLRLATVDEAVLGAAAAAVDELVRALQPGASPDVADVVDDWAADRHLSAEAIVVWADRFLRLAWSHEALVLALVTAATVGVPTGAELLRIYWYDGAPDRLLTDRHLPVAEMENVKLRLGRSTVRGQKGVEGLTIQDLIILARQSAIADAVVVSGDEDLLEAIESAQS